MLPKISIFLSSRKTYRLEIHGSVHACPQLASAVAYGASLIELVHGVNCVIICSMTDEPLSSISDSATQEGKKQI